MHLLRELTPQWLVRHLVLALDLLLLIGRAPNQHPPHNMSNKLDSISLSHEASKSMDQHRNILKVSIGHRSNPHRFFDSIANTLMPLPLANPKTTVVDKLEAVLRQPTLVIDPTLQINIELLA